MQSRYFLFLLLVFIGLRAKSQTLLNLNLIQIRKEFGLNEGGVNKGSIENNKSANGYYQKFVVNNQLPPEGNTCLMRTTFYLTLKNKCFKYCEDYWGNELADKRIYELKKYYPRLIKAEGALHWVDIYNNFELTLIPKKLGKNNFASVYTVEIKSIL